MESRGMAKLWGGRFEESTDEVVQLLNNSLSFDSRLWREDIRGSIAHAMMLDKQGIIPHEDAGAIATGLYQILAEMENEGLEPDPAQEDIHSAIEALLHERIGAAAGKL